MIICDCPCCGAEFNIPDIQYLSPGAEFDGNCQKCGNKYTLKIEYEGRE